MVMYIWEPGTASDRVSAAVIERGKAGVACRIVIDSFGSSGFPAKLAPALTQAGCEVRMFRPLPGVAPLARNHRKLVVIDGAIGITGGFGIRDNWLGDGVTGGAWRDANIRFTGPAVHDAQQAFAENWQEAGGALLPADVFPAPSATAGGARAAFIASTGTSVVTRAERLTQLAIAAAKKRLWIVNAYVVPSPAIIELIERKARSGVDVRILAPGSQSDSKPAVASQKKLFPQLRKAGVRIWEYQGSMIHSKTMLADDQLAVVGTINLDPLSLNLLDESALLVEDPAIAAALARSFEADLLHAVEVGK
jgi:cardiolipin synthase